MKGINILHLSDIHFRPQPGDPKRKENDENDIFRQEVQTKLVDAVKTHSKEHGHVDFVVVTGDIAFSGKEHEYDEALKFFGKLKTILPDNLQFLPVPGNHDVDRDEVDPFTPPYYVVKNRLVDKFLQQPEQVKRKVNVKFKAFRKFSDQLHPELYKPNDNYFWVKNVEEKNVSFLGLNSAWASEGDGDRFNIALGYPQVAAALEKAAEIPNRVVLMHHPPFNWLEERDFHKCSSRLFNTCGLILHGHVHFDTAACISTPSDSCISIGANASYTNDGFIGFQFIRVDFKENRTTVRVWPYKMDDRERVAFFQDTRRWEGQKGKTYFDLSSRGPCAGEEDTGLPPLQIPPGYRDWVLRFHSRMETEQLDPNARAFHVPLPDVYIPIETTNPFHRPEEKQSIKEGGIKSAEVDLEEEVEDSKEPAYIDIEQFIGRQNCVLLRGAAGMGKTTLIKHLAYTLTCGMGPVSLCELLPVVVFLKDLWPLYEKEIEKETELAAGSSVTFQALLGIYLKIRVDTLEAGVVEDFLQRDRALFLLDGLDEVPVHLRRGMVEIIAAFRVKYENNRFLLTGRPHGIDEGVMHHFGDFLHDIEPLDNKKIKTFIFNWFRVVSGQAAGLADVTAAEMMGDIEINPYVSVFTQNPLLLTAVCILYLDNKRLPDQRAELYRRIVDNLVNRRFHTTAAPENISRIEDYLKLLAFHMQERNIKIIAVGAARELLKEIFPRGEKTVSQYNREIHRLFEEIEPRCGLLKRREEGEVEFFHLTFQEFLAARHMLYTDTDYTQFLENSWWEETILLYTGLINRDWKDKANRLVKDILTRIHTDTQTRCRLWLLGAKALRDIQAYKRDAEITALAVEKLPAVIESGTSLKVRFDAGEILGTLGDPRIQPPPTMPLVTVDAGQFTRGANDGDDDEKPVRRIHLDAFKIGKYPVTNQEFKVFIHENGFETEAFWTPEGWQWRKEKNITEPRYWHDRKWNGPNFPVVGVSWYEAAAYAKWLSATTGDDYFLPTEAQWEKAARGPDGFTYPWGDTFDKNLCNSFESGLHRTSPVGIFPEGKSPYGCMDMAGNVREWCADWFEEKYYKESPVENPQGPLGGSVRVIRGGGWGSGAHGCRAAFRGGLHPADRWGGVGFRLVRSL